MGVMNAPLFWPFITTGIILSAAFLGSIISASKDYECQFAVSQTFINMAMPCIVLFGALPPGVAASRENSRAPALKKMSCLFVCSCPFLLL